VIKSSLAILGHFIYITQADMLCCDRLIGLHMKVSACVQEFQYVQKTMRVRKS